MDLTPPPTAKGMLASSPTSFTKSKESSTKRLNLMVKRGREVDVEYSRKFIIDRINKLLGYEFINEIKLTTFKNKKK